MLNTGVVGWFAQNIGLLYLALAIVFACISAYIMKVGDTMIKLVIGSIVSTGSSFFISMAANTIPLT